MKKHTLLTFNERQIIQDLLGWKLSPSKIAKKLNRTRRCILMEILKNTIDGPYNAEQAHNASYVRRKAAVRKAVEEKQFNALGEKEKLLQRISSLEMHVEIILDQLKELYERNSKNN